MRVPFLEQWLTAGRKIVLANQGMVYRFLRDKAKCLSQLRSQQGRKSVNKRVNTVGGMIKPRQNSVIAVRWSPLDARRGLLRLEHLAIQTALGRSGIGSGKREGDGKTPRAAMRLLYGFYRADRIMRPATRLPLIALKPGMLWCDAPDHPAYNRLVNAPFPASHETLMREDHLYDVCLVMDWNVRSRRRGGGSAIFLHLARPGYRPTEGCVAVSLKDMRKLLSIARYGTIVKVL
jgi:L,D-peptidoglycan transpeptidase YkuD (ErfK/YbiS/YcfS/YnhG family)